MGNILLIFMSGICYVGFIYIQSNISGTPYIHQSTLNEYYSQSKLGIYYEDKLIPNADQASFKVLNIPYYGKDKNSVFWGDTKVAHADPESFVMINQRYSKDKDRVFFKGIEILQADANSFMPIKGDYSKDKNRVYINRYTISLADPDSFEILNEFWAKDAKHVYYQGGLRPEIDAPTFITMRHQGYDKNFAYGDLGFVAGVDTATLTKESLYYKDKNHVYSSSLSPEYIFYGKDNQPIDPKFFEYVENIDPVLKRDLSYYKTKEGICFDDSNGMRVRCEESK